MASSARLRLWVALTLSLAIACETGLASAGDDEKAACFAAHEQGQLLRKDGKLREARASFFRCSSDACPALARKDCLAWAEEVGAAQPTVLVEAKDPRGNDTGEVRFLVDGQLVAARVGGSPIELDPGEHSMRYEMQGAEPIEQRVILRSGEKDRKLLVPFHSLSVERVDTKTRLVPAPIPTAAYVLGGLSIVSLGLFLGFAVGGKNLEKSLAASCVTHCSPDQVAPVKNDYLVADVALGTSVVAASVALVLVLFKGKRPAQGSTSGHALEVRPLGAGAALSASF